MIKVNLKQILKQKNITLTELSLGTGISLRGLSAFQNQKTDGVQYNTIDAICSFLEIEVSDLLKKFDDIYAITCEIKVIDLPFKLNIEEEQIYDIEGSIVIFNEIDRYTFNFSLDIQNRIKSDFNTATIMINSLNKPNKLPKKINDFIDLNNLEDYGSPFYKITSYLIAQEIMQYKNFPNISVWDDLWVKWSNDIIPRYEILNLITDETMYGSTSEKLIFPKKEYRINTVPKNPKEKITNTENFVDFKVQYAPNFDSLVNIRNIAEIKINKDFIREVYIDIK